MKTLQPDTEVSFLGVKAIVVKDNGKTLTVKMGDNEYEWHKEANGHKVEALSVKPTEKPKIPFHLKGAFDQINGLKGRIGTLTYEKNIAKVKVKHKALLEGKTLVKRSVFQVRAGIEYENIKLVKEKHESGERERKGLPDSMLKIEKGVYYHIFKEQFYVGCAPVHNENSVRTKEFILDGEVVELDHDLGGGVTLEDVLLAADKKSSNDADWMTLPIENVKDLK